MRLLATFAGRNIRKQTILRVNCNRLFEKKLFLKLTQVFFKLDSALASIEKRIYISII